MDLGLPVVADEAAMGVAVALGIGLLVGIERERAKGQGPDRRAAGVRTHALLALAGAVAALVAPWLVAVVAAVVGLLAWASYRPRRERDPGLTSEVAMVLVALLGALAVLQPGLAAAVGVLVAVLLAAKPAMHRFTREWLSQGELHDLLLLAAAALVVLPLLPDRALGPYEALNPALVWRLVVLLMAVGALGHVALRLAGARRGLALAGLFAGFASSTAVTAAMGARARSTPTLRRPAVAAAMLANLASLLLLAVVVAAVSPALLQASLPALGAAALVLAAGGALGLRGGGDDAGTALAEASARAFRLGQALLVAAMIAGVLLASAALGDWLGPRGAVAAAVASALAEVHAAAITVAKLSADDRLGVDAAVQALVAALAVAAVAKSALALATGGRAYGWRVAVGLLAAVAAGGGAEAARRLLGGG